MNRILLLLAYSFFAFTTQAQIGIQVVVDSGMATSDCTDPFGGAPDPLFAAAAEGGTYNYYPAVGACFNTLPDTIYQANFPCLSAVPMTVEICLRVSENDAFFQPPLGCDIAEDCIETICDNFVVPMVGNTVNYTLAIDVPGSSSGSISFSIETAGFAFPDNDFICNAVDLGTLIYGDTLGDMTVGNYANLCATDIGEIDPQSLGYYFTNQAGVWFKFNTGPNPSGLFVVQGLSDPNNVGEPIDLELGVFLTDNNACDGNLVALSGYNFNSSGFDTEFRVPCPQPNRDYYIWVDGANNNGDYRGIFGIQVWDIGVLEGGDLRCDVMDLGVVPEGGTVSTPEPISNFCATDVQDPFLPTFVSQHSVWFSFTAPPSGHVIIEGVSDTIKQAIGVQLALYRSFNNTCSGFYSYVTSQYTPADLDETMEVTCLYPGRVYYILVDGSGGASRGVFELTVTDAGDITPVNNQTITLCAGETLEVGPNDYTTSGIYFDTLQVFQGCDSIVISDLTVLEELVLTVEQTQPAIGIDGTDGVGIASATGGTGNYTFTWCTGETGTMATNLVADELCCVQVTDENGCMDEVCFTVEFTTAIIPIFMNDTLLCNGDTNGLITFSAINGVLPYDYAWTNTAGTLNGNGQILTEGGSIDIPNLPAGNYDITVNDNFFDTTFTVLVVQPEELLIDLQDAVDASCFAFCDGSISTLVSGGTLPYSYSWTGGVSNNELATQLCTGAYELVVTDANGCVAILNTNIDQPTEFIATASMVQEVSCFAGADGVAQVVDNGNSVAWNWSSGSMTQIANQLAAGTYTVQVTNGDGCRDTATVAITQPLAPLTVAITELAPISCFDSQDGQLGALVNGPFATLAYSWSNAAITQNISNLDIGTYQLLVTNEKGCEAMAMYTLDQPTEVIAESFAVDINCVDGPNAGIITVENVSGGTPGYNYSIDGENFGPVPLFEGLTAGTYDVVVRDAAGCELPLLTNIFPPPPISVALMGDSIVKLGDELTLAAISSSFDVLYSWSHADTLSGSTALLRPQETFVYQVSVFDTLTFCSASDFLRVFVDSKPRIFVPNIFSPNGDGSNDTFIPFAGNDVVNFKSLRIFDRYGQLVYEETDILPGDTSRGWDGTFRGESLNPSVFVYFMEVEFFDGRVEIVKGDVTLMR